MLHTRKPTRHVAWRWETAFFQDTTQREESSCTWLWAHTSAHRSFWSVFLNSSWLEDCSRNRSEEMAPSSWSKNGYIKRYIYIWRDRISYLNWTRLYSKMLHFLVNRGPSSFIFHGWLRNGKLHVPQLQIIRWEVENRSPAVQAVRPKPLPIWKSVAVCPFGCFTSFFSWEFWVSDCPPSCSPEGDMGFVFFSILPALGCPMLSLFASFVHVHLPKYGGSIWWWWSWTLKTDCVHWNLNSLRWPWWDLWSCASSLLCSPWRQGELCCQDLPSLFLGLAELESQCIAEVSTHVELTEVDVTLAKIEEIDNHFIAWTSSVLVPW